MESKENKIRIAFMGKKSSGKDTCFELISQIYENCVNLKFAGPLYKILTYAQNTCKFKVEKDRKFLQYIGTQWGRDIDKNVWLNLMKESIENNNDKNIIITDLRFQNEFDYLKKNNFIIVKLVRDYIPTEQECEKESLHISENDLNECTSFDYEIYNNNLTLDKLSLLLKSIITSHFM